jgi:hypothetical protein
LYHDAACPKGGLGPSFAVFKHKTAGGVDPHSLGRHKIGFGRRFGLDDIINGDHSVKMMINRRQTQFMVRSITP